MSRAIRFLPAIVLIGGGAAIIASHPEWGRLRGGAVLMLLLAAIVSIGLLSFRPRKDPTVSRPAPKVHKSLVGISSAAILAVYAAGYHRTSFAEDKFAQQAARRRMAVPLPSSAVASTVVTPRATEISKALPLPIASPGSNHSARTSVTPAPQEAATPTPATPAPATPGIENSPAKPEAPPTEVASTNIPVVQPAAATAADSPAPQPVAPPAAKVQGKYKDGVYLGWGSSRHGDIQASVLIQGGQIAAAEVTQCLTRYSCSWIADLPGLVISKQSADVDLVSGATESSDAFLDAVSMALTKANE